MSDHLFPTRITELRKTQFREPIVFGGFVGPGLVGLVSARYMIEKLNLHEVAHVQSQHIPPVAVFVGAKLRHPFRIYSDDEGKIVVVLSEMPIDIEGLYEISSALLDWFEQIRAKEIVVLD
ncbi:MAG: proteasome assembly chaperone family protein, partial [Nitrososphaerales archaeon]